MRATETCASASTLQPSTRLESDMVPFGRKPRPLPQSPSNTGVKLRSSIACAGFVSFNSLFGGLVIGATDRFASLAGSFSAHDGTHHRAR